MNQGGCSFAELWCRTCTRVWFWDVFPQANNISPVERHLSTVSTGLEPGQSSSCKDTCGKRIINAFAQVREDGTGVEESANVKLSMQGICNELLRQENMT